jgi:hypothetical protein
VSHLSFSQLMVLVVASRATIYTVGLFDQNDQELNPGILRRLANVSGGEYFQPVALDQVIPTFEKISKDIRNRYTVGYIPDETGNGRAVRSVKVSAQADGRKLSVRTRTNYSVPPRIH